LGWVKAQSTQVENDHRLPLATRIDGEDRIRIATLHRAEKHGGGSLVGTG